MKNYLPPQVRIVKLEFADGIAIIFDPNQSGDIQLGKQRDEDFGSDNSRYGSGKEWSEGLW